MRKLRLKQNEVKKKKLQPACVRGRFIRDQKEGS